MNAQQTAAGPNGDAPVEEHSDNVRDLLRKEKTFSSRLAGLLGWFKQSRERRVVAAVTLGTVVLIGGYALGGGFGDPEPVANGAGGYFITEEQAEERRQQTLAVTQTESELAIAVGELAFLRNQVATLTGDLQGLRQSVDSAQVEMGIIVAIYEECLSQIHPVQCVEEARPKADAFIDQLYSPAD